MNKLTPAQLDVLRALAVNEASAYRLGCSLNTLNALSLKGFVSLVSSLGNMAFPRNATWRITEAGRALLSRIS